MGYADDLKGFDSPEERPECKNCNNFDLSENVCLIDNSKGYKNKKCLHPNCQRWQKGEWSPQ